MFHPSAEGATGTLLIYTPPGYNNRTIPNKDNRAIGDFSRGGGQPLNIGCLDEL